MPGQRERREQGSRIIETAFREPKAAERHAVSAFFATKARKARHYPLLCAKGCSVLVVALCLVQLIFFRDKRDPSLIILAFVIAVAALGCAIYAFLPSWKYRHFIGGDFEVLEGYALRCRFDTAPKGTCDVLFRANEGKEYRRWYRVAARGLAQDDPLIVVRTVPLDGSTNMYMAFTQSMLRPYYPRNGRRMTK